MGPSIRAEARPPADAGSGGPDEGDQPDEADAPLAPLSLRVLVLVGFAGVVVLRPGLPENAAFVDPALALLAIVALSMMNHQGSAATSAAVRCLPWIWLILLGSFLGLAGVGIPIWAYSSLARTVFALVTFFAVWHLLMVTRTERWAVRGLVVGLLITLAALVLIPFEYRGQAFFQHPNYAGHFGVMACVTVWALAHRWRTRAFAAVALGLVLALTASFGAMAMTVSIVAVASARSLARSTGGLAIGLGVVAVAGLFVANPGADAQQADRSAPWEVSGVISEERLDRSSTGRTEAWGTAIDAWLDSPFGLGPDGVRNQGLIELEGETNIELHSDPLGYLVERGPIGLIGYFGLWATIWMCARPGGLARLLIIGILVQGIFRETMHYRHMWLILALAMAHDHLRHRSAPPVEHELDLDEPLPALTPLRDPGR